MKRLSLFLFLFCLLLTIPSQARIITVDDDEPADFNNIQAAINDANDGDTISVADGTYTGQGNRDINFLGKAITVRSTNPDDSSVVAATIIDCQNSGRGFIFQNSEGLHSILSGLTIVNGYTSSSGGGIYCSGSSPIVANCTFSRNSSEGNGGGIYCGWYSNVTVRNCTFINNSADSGGGMYNKRSDPTLVHCTFVGNFSTYGGGGGVCNGSGSAPTLTNCRFVDNVADRYYGGGIRSADSHTILTNCTFSRNSANRGGGGMSHNGEYKNITVTNCTFSSNFGGSEGGRGGIYSLGSSPVIRSCIFWSNSDSYGMGELSQIGPETPAVNYSCIQGWTGALGGTGNIGADPCFVDPLRDDCHLLANSPCINTGDPSYSGTGETDIDGQPRVIGGRVDMGADEFNLEEPSIGISPPAFEFLAGENGPNPQPQILFIYNAGIGTVDWEVSDDCSWLQVAPTSGDSTGEIDEVTLSVDVTGLARGKYNCVLTISDPAVTNSPQTVEVNLLVQAPIIELSANRFEFHADMNGTNPADQILAIRNSGMDTLNWQVTESCFWLEGSPTSGSSTGQINNVTLSVDIVALAKGKYDCELTVSDSNAENSPQIIEVILYIGIEGVLLVPAEYGTIQSAIDDADDGDIVIVADGIYMGTGNRDIDFKGKAITVRSENGAANCIIDCQGSESEPHRGFYFHLGEGPSSVVRGFTVTGGYTTSSFLSGGGAIECIDASPTIANCIFRGNYAIVGGGAIHFAFFASPEIINCTFHGNVAGFRGGAVSTDSCVAATLRNCIIWGNIPADGPGVYVGLCGDFGGGVAAPVNVYYSLLQAPWQYGENNIVADPCFAEPNSDDYHLKSQAGRWDTNSQSWVEDDVTSPCIDAGNPGCPLGDEPNDPNNIRINMGAYGGTAEASKSPANWRNIADLTNDWVVDFNDLKVFVRHWLETGECIPSDLDRSQFVDFNDFAIFGLQWSQPSASEQGMTFQIDDCNMEEGQSWPVAAESNEPRFSVWVEGRYIHFEDSMFANCCPDELELEMTVEDNLITIYEIEYTSEGCRCMCSFPITATLGPFEDGTYTVEVYDNYGNSLGVVEVTIGGSTGPGITYQIEDCNQEAPALFSAEPPGQTRFTVTVDGQNILFEDMMTANCCPDGLGLQMTVEDSLITIYETEYTPGGCWCICDYPVTATLGPFEPGIYTLEVYEDWGGFIASTTVVIAPPE